MSKQINALPSITAVNLIAKLELALYGKLTCGSKTVPQQVIIKAEYMQSVNELYNYILELEKRCAENNL